MKVYDVRGIRHQVVVIAETSEQAVSQALANGRIGDWEVPEAREIPLPPRYALSPARQSVEWLGFAMQEAWDTLRGRLAGLTDEEFFWQPVPGCWTVHQDERGRWVEDYAVPAPEPAPFTTIAWRLVHVAACKIMYHEYAFGAGKLTWDELPLPHTVADTVAQLEEGQSRLRAALAGLTDADLAEERLTNWGELWPAWRIFEAMTLHDMHHGGEIGCLRDLYRWRARR